MYAFGTFLGIGFYAAISLWMCKLLNDRAAYNFRQGSCQCCPTTAQLSEAPGKSRLLLCADKQGYQQSYDAALVGADRSKDIVVLRVLNLQVHFCMKGPSCPFAQAECIWQSANLALAYAVNGSGTAAYEC